MAAILGASGRPATMVRIEGGSYIICQQNFVTLRLCTRAELEAEGIVLQ